MYRISKVFCTFIVSIVISSQASALGLGDLQINSKIGFPLDAYLPLSGAKNFNPGELTIQLAGNDAYDEADVFRSYFLTRIKFTVVDRGEYGKLVRVQSEKPVLDPNLELIIQADSDDGSIYRHYSVLVDFP